MKYYQIKERSEFQLVAIKEIPKGYKKTDIGIIPIDWKVNKLPEVGECFIGLTYSPLNVKPYGTLVLRSSNVQNGKLAFENNVYVNMELPKRVIVKENDILICVRNGSRQLIGKCALIDKKTAGSAFGAFMSIFRSEFSVFIFHQFQSYILQRQINETLGATINQITIRDLASFQIPLPPTKEEQTAIATALNDADELINSLEKLIAKKRMIKQGAMQELLKPNEGWEHTTVEKLGKPYGGLSGKSKDDFSNGNSPYIPFMNIMNNPVIDITYFDYVKIRQNENQNKTQFGDLFFNGSSETPEEVGMCSVLLDDVPSLYLNSFCFGFRLNKDLNTNGLYLAYYFRSSYGRNIFYILAQGATRHNLSKSNFLKIEFQIPDPTEQTRIAQVLSDMDSEIVTLEKKLEKYKMLKQGMMQNLLTGKIRLV